MLLLQKAVHASTALDGPGGRTCYCREIYCIDLQSIYRLNVLPSCSGPGDRSLLVPPSLSNVSRPGHSDILLCCTLLYFLYYPLRPMAIKSIQLQLQAPHSIIQYIHSLASLLILLSLWFILLMLALNGFLSPSYTLGKAGIGAKQLSRKANHNVVQEPQQRSQKTAVVDSENLSGGAKS